MRRLIDTYITLYDVKARIYSLMVQVMLGAKLLPEPVLTYFQSDTHEQISVKFKTKYKIIYKT